MKPLKLIIAMAFVLTACAEKEGHETYSCVDGVVYKRSVSGNYYVSLGAPCIKELPGGRTT